MKRKIQIQELVEILTKEQTEKRDMIVPANKFEMETGRMVIKDFDANPSALQEVLLAAGIGPSEGSRTEFDMTAMFHDDLAAKLDIPRFYYDRLLTSNESLLHSNVNGWLNHKENSKRNFMLRSFEKEDGTRIARCLLSDRYFIIDHLDILFSVMKVIKENGMNVQITDCDITEKNMYVRFVCPEIEVQAPELLKNYRVPKGGDSGNPTVISGFVIKNSETGDGGLTISPRAQILACSNGLIRKEDSYKKIHLGAKLSENTYIDWSKDTIRKNMELVQSQMIDCVRRFSSKEYLGMVIQDITEKGNVELKHPVDCTKNVCNHFKMSDKEMSEIMNYFITGGQSTAFGVSQALTYFAHETENADLQYEMEAAGYDIIDKIGVFDRITKK